MWFAPFLLVEPAHATSCMDLPGQLQYNVQKCSNTMHRSSNLARLMLVWPLLTESFASLLFSCTLPAVWKLPLGYLRGVSPRVRVGIKVSIWVTHYFHHTVSQTWQHMETGVMGLVMSLKITTIRLHCEMLALACWH